jgi:hypothetical protein
VEPQQSIDQNSHLRDQYEKRYEYDGAHTPLNDQPGNISDDVHDYKSDPLPSGSDGDLFEDHLDGSIQEDLTNSSGDADEELYNVYQEYSSPAKAIPVKHNPSSHNSPSGPSSPSGPTNPPANREDATLAVRDAERDVTAVDSSARADMEVLDADQRESAAPNKDGKHVDANDISDPRTDTPHHSQDQRQEHDYDSHDAHADQDYEKPDGGTHDYIYAADNSTDYANHSDYPNEYDADYFYGDYGDYAAEYYDEFLSSHFNDSEHLQYGDYYEDYTQPESAGNDTAVNEDVMFYDTTESEFSTKTAIEDTPSVVNTTAPENQEGLLSSDQDTTEAFHTPKYDYFEEFEHSEEPERLTTDANMDPKTTGGEIEPEEMGSDPSEGAGDLKGRDEGMSSSQHPGTHSPNEGFHHNHYHSQQDQSSPEYLKSATEDHYGYNLEQASSQDKDRDLYEMDSEHSDVDTQMDPHNDAEEADQEMAPDTPALDARMQDIPDGEENPDDIPDGMMDRYSQVDPDFAGLDLYDYPDDWTGRGLSFHGLDPDFSFNDSLDAGDGKDHPELAPDGDDSGSQNSDPDTKTRIQDQTNSPHTETDTDPELHAGESSIDPEGADYPDPFHIPPDAIRPWETSKQYPPPATIPVTDPEPTKAGTDAPDNAPYDDPDSSAIPSKDTILEGQEHLFAAYIHPSETHPTTPGIPSKDQAPEGQEHLFGAYIHPSEIIHRPEQPSTLPPTDEDQFAMYTLPEENSQLNPDPDHVFPQIHELWPGLEASNKTEPPVEVPRSSPSHIPGYTTPRTSPGPNTPAPLDTTFPYTTTQRSAIQTHTFHVQPPTSSLPPVITTSSGVGDRRIPDVGASPGGPVTPGPDTTTRYASTEPAGREHNEGKADLRAGMFITFILIIHQRPLCNVMGKSFWQG